MKKSCILLFILVLLSTFGYAQSDKSSSTNFETLHRAYLSDRAEPRGDNEESPSATDSILRFWLTPQIVNNNQPVANTFYFWTTQGELDSAVRQNQLLRTTEVWSPLGRNYWADMSETETNPEPIAIHLRSGERQRVRFAWPNYWGILTEEEQESGIDQLVKVVLMDSALIVAFDPQHRKTCWTIFDLHGQVVPMDKAMERTRHIAAVFIAGSTPVKFTAPRRERYRDSYRTFALCNESMIKSWHHAVPGMQDRIIQDLDYLLLLNAYLDETGHRLSQGKRGANCIATWVKPAGEMRVSELFFATQCWAGALHYPADSRPTTKVINVLRDYWPKQVKPCERYPGKK